MHVCSSEAKAVDGIDGIPGLLTGWKSDFIQLGRGRMRAGGIRIGLSGAQLTYLCVARRTIFRALTAADELTLLFVPRTEPAAISGSRAIHGADCLAAGPSARLEVLLPEHASLLMLSRRCGHPWQRPDELRHLPSDGCGFRTLRVELVELLTLCAQRLGRLWRPRTAAAELERVHAELQDSTLAGIETVFEGAAPNPVSFHAGTIRRMAVSRACDFIESHARGQLSLQELCAAAGVGMRTLEYGFREAYGLGPMAYLRSFRLGRVRGDLAIPGDAGVSVTAVARRWCFSHMGQFSKDYRIQFGESPSVTLRRSRQRQNWACARPAVAAGRPA